MKKHVQTQDDDSSNTATGAREENPFHVQQTAVDTILHMPMPVFGIDASTGTIAFTNNHAETLFGIPREEFLGTYPNDVFPPALSEALKQMLETLRRDNQNSEMEIEVPVKIPRTGTRHFCVSAMNQKQDEHSFVYCRLRDITERKIAEEKLQKQNELQQILFEITRYFNSHSFDEAVLKVLCKLGTYYRATRTSVLIMKNNGEFIENLYDWCAQGIPSVKDVLHSVSFDIFAPWISQLKKHKVMHIYADDINRMSKTNEAAAYDYLKQTHIESMTLVSLFVANRFYGILVLMDTQRKLVWNKEDMILLNVLADIIISAWKRQQASQALMEDHYRHLIEGLPDAVFLINEDLSIHLANASGQRLLEQIRNKGTLTDVCSIFTECEYSIQRLFETGMAVECEGTLLGLDGVWHQRLIPVFENGDRVDHLTLILRDITKETQINKSLERADKLATLGTLAAGVAHEINNPNHVITINTPIICDIWRDVEPLVRRAMEAGELPMLADIPTEEFLEEIPELHNGIKQSAEKIKSIVTRLKDYVRERPMARSSVTINDVIRDAISMLQSRLKQIKGNFVFHAGENLPLTAGDAQQLEQVLINLLLNACDATADYGGQITIASAYDEQTEHITVTVSDDGIGMKPDVLLRIGDPFYTTKLERGGTGLGVSISMRILEDHGGELKYTSKQGKGTTATIRLPVIYAEGERETGNGGEEDEPPRNSITD